MHAYTGRAKLAGRLARTLTALVGLTMLVDPPSPAAAEVAPAPVPVAATPVLVSGGAGNQTDPHISGTLVTYTNSTDGVMEIRYHDLATDQDDAIPTGGHRDSLSDVDGSTVVFRRVFTDGSSARRPIMAFDVTNPGTPPVEIAPDPTARREFARLGGSTVAWVELIGPSSNQTDIVVHDLVTGVTTRLTNDASTRMNRSRWSARTATWSPGRPACTPG